MCVYAHLQVCVQACLFGCMCASECMHMCAGNSQCSISLTAPNTFPRGHNGHQERCNSQPNRQTQKAEVGVDLTGLKQGPEMESFVNMKKMSLRDIHKEDMAMKKSKKRKASDPSGCLFRISIKVEFCLMKSTTYHRIGEFVLKSVQRQEQY